MTEPSLQFRLVRYLLKSHSYINGGELEKLGESVGYKASNVSRRLRVLEEASRGIWTTPEHVRAGKLLRHSLVERVEKKGPNSRVSTVWYRIKEKKSALQLASESVAYFNAL